jgi:glutaryl-CoA transferase
MMAPSDPNGPSGRLPLGALPTGSLEGVRILDLSRILAGPSATQILGDLGADVIKVEHPVRGDDTRKWGPPFVKDSDGNDTSEAAYYLAANRNKRSVGIDIGRPEGAALVRKLAAEADILVENFKVGGLKKFGLGYEDLKEDFPGLIYCSITGFGQKSPYADRPGYDFLAQAAGGIMSVTGEPDGVPMKTGVGIADQMCGMYAVIGILAALRHRDLTAQGQQIDVSLLDTQMAWLANIATHYLVSGEEPERLGNAHPNIVPYKVYKTADGHVVLCVGNDRQFADWCALAEEETMATDPLFATNAARVRNRQELEVRVEAAMCKKSTTGWIEALTKVDVPCGPVNSVQQAFDDPHTAARGLIVSVPHARSASGQVDLVANPLKFSVTPPSYRRGPPILGQDTDDVLGGELGLSANQIKDLRDQSIIA